MPINGYMKKLEPGRISTIGMPGDDKRRRKRIKAIVGSSETHYRELYVLDCTIHDRGGVVVPVTLWKYPEEFGEPILLGVAKCCPLCWRILVPPAGVEFPPVKRQELKPIKKGRSVIRRSVVARPEIDGKTAFGAVYQWVIAGGAFSDIEFTAQDLVAATGHSRPGIVEALGKLVRNGKVEVVRRGGGRGSRTFYRKAP